MSFDLIPILFLCVIANSMICLGVYMAAKFDNSDQFDDHPELYRDSPIRDKMIFWWIRYYGSYLPEYWRKPFYLCIICMASIYSIPTVVAISYLADLSLLQGVILFPFYSLSVCGLNTIISYKVI